MNRVFTSFATERVKKQLTELLESQNDSARYRLLMKELGRELGLQLQDQLQAYSSLCVVCTVEDADYLARGLLETLSESPKNLKVSLVCFWHEQMKIDQDPELRIAPIVRRYVEPLDPASLDTIVVVKSIISSSCTVRTAITELLQSVDPKHIFVVAPVMYSGSTTLLEKEFSPDTAKKFTYIYFAQDADRDKETGIVTPGIGGNVYQLLGFTDMSAKNRYRPQLLADRRKLLAHR